MILCSYLKVHLKYSPPFYSSLSIELTTPESNPHVAFFFSFFKNAIWLVIKANLVCRLIM